MQLLLMTPVVSAQEIDPAPAGRWYVSDYVPIQFAGNIGLFSVGAGYATNHDSYHLNLLYGYAPSSVTGVEIHTVTAKNTFPLLKYGLKSGQTLIPYLGIGLTVEVGGNAFFRMPSHYPEGYYSFPKNVHVIAYGGARLRHLFHEDFKLLDGIEFYVESGTVDIYVWYKAMSNQIRLTEIFSVALGVNLLLPG